MHLRYMCKTMDIDGEMTQGSSQTIFSPGIKIAHLVQMSLTFVYDGQVNKNNHRNN